MLMLLTLTTILVIITAALTLLESILIYVDEVRLAYILSHQPPRKKLLKEIVKNKQAYLSSMVLLINLISIGGSAITGGLASQVLNDWHLVIFSMTLTYVMLVFAKMLPKLLGPQMAHKTLPRASLLLYILYLCVTPLRWLTQVWATIFKVKTQNDLCVDELKFMLRHYNQEGLIHKETRKALEQVLAAEEKTINKLAKPASDLYLRSEESIELARLKIGTDQHKRYLLKTDHEISGVVLLSNINEALVNQQGALPMQSLAKKISFLSPDTPLLDALHTLSKEKASLGVVLIDEQPHTVSSKVIYRAILKKGKRASKKKRLNP